MDSGGHARRLLKWLQDSDFIKTIANLRTLMWLVGVPVVVVGVAWSSARSARSAVATFVGEHPEGTSTAFVVIVSGLMAAVVVLWSCWRSTAKKLREVGSRLPAVAEQNGPFLDSGDVTARLVKVEGDEHEHRLEIMSTSGEVRQLRWVLPRDQGEWHIPPTEATIEDQTVAYPLRRLPRGVTLYVPAVARGPVRPLYIEIQWQTGIGTNADEHTLRGYLEPDAGR